MMSAMNFYEQVRHSLVNAKQQGEGIRMYKKFFGDIFIVILLQKNAFSRQNTENAETA